MDGLRDGWMDGCSVHREPGGCGQLHNAVPSSSRGCVEFGYPGQDGRSSRTFGVMVVGVGWRCWAAASPGGAWGLTAD